MEFEAKLYNPAAQPEDFLIEHFVVRTKVFERIFEDIRTGTMEHPEQHYLVQGQRGMGKTTLLLRLKYEIERTAELNEWMLPIFFNEESYDLTSLSSLWEKLLKYFDRLLPDGGHYYNATDKFMGSNDYEQKCFNLVTDTLHKHKKKLIILFDNFGELFLDNLNERDSHRFREILMTSADIRIIAGSAVVLESGNDYAAPFFDFFKIINLEGLSKDETLELIKKLQEKSAKKIDLKANKAKIDTLAILSGGVIRTIMMLYEILLNDTDGSALKDLESILDKVTPLYKHRMEDLKPQQRRIMDVIGKNWDAISVKDISKNIRENGKAVPSKTISAQLQELVKNNLVEKRGTSTKNNFYIVKERFFNIWYLMRHGDKTSQCKVKWLTRFLEMWYGDNGKEIHSFIEQHISLLKSGAYIPSSAILMANALAAIPQIKFESLISIVEETEKILADSDRKYLPKFNRKLIVETLGKALKYMREKEFKKTYELLETIEFKGKEIYEGLGVAYFSCGDYNKAIENMEKIYSSESSANLNLDLATAYQQLKIDNKALYYVNIALKKQNELDIDQIKFAKGIKIDICFVKPELNEECTALAIETTDWEYTPATHELALYQLINERHFKEAIKIIEKLDIYNENADAINDILMLLMRQKQNHLSLNLFKAGDGSLIDRLKPTYYALMYLMKGELPDEYLKMGKELEEPVRDILKSIGGDEATNIDFGFGSN